MPTTIPDAPVALTVRDVILPNQRYSPEEIAERLGIFPNVFDDRKLQAYPEITQHFGSGANLQLLGRQAAAAVERLERENQLTVTISDRARREYEARQRKAAPKPPRKLNPVEQATQRLKDRRERDAQLEAEAEARDWQRYLAILLKGDELTDDDIDVLASLIDHLKLTEANISDDRRLIKRIRHREQKHDNRQAAHQEYIDAMAAFREVEKRHKEEFDAASRRRNRAEAERSECTNAAYELTRLQRQRPQFMTEGDVKSPPRLLVPLTSASAESSD